MVDLSEKKRLTRSYHDSFNLKNVPLDDLVEKFKLEVHWPEVTHSDVMRDIKREKKNFFRKMKR